MHDSPQIMRLRRHLYGAAVLFSGDELQVVFAPLDARVNRGLVVEEIGEWRKPAAISPSDRVRTCGHVRMTM